MITMWEYTIETTTNFQEITMPIGSEIMHVDEQHGKICLWVLTDTEETQMAERVIAIVETGEEISDIFTYLGTVKLVNGKYIAHVLEILQ